MFLILMFACDVDNDSFSKRAGDCDDQEMSVYPNAPEICDGIPDNDCNEDSRELVVPDDYESISVALEEYTENDIICIRGTHEATTSETAIDQGFTLGGFVDEESVLDISALKINIEVSSEPLVFTNIVLTGSPISSTSFVSMTEGTLELNNVWVQSVETYNDAVFSVINSNVVFRDVVIDSVNTDDFVGQHNFLNFEGEYSNTAIFTDVTLQNSGSGFSFEKGEVFFLNFKALNNSRPDSNGYIVKTEASIVQMGNLEMIDNTNMNVEIDFAGTTNIIENLMYASNRGSIVIESNENVSTPPELIGTNFVFQNNTFELKYESGRNRSPAFRDVDIDHVQLVDNVLSGSSGLNLEDSNLTHVLAVENVSSSGESVSQTIKLIGDSTLQNFIVEGISTGSESNRYAIRTECENSLQFGVVFGGAANGSNSAGGGVRHGCGTNSGSSFGHMVLMNNFPDAFSPSYDGAAPKLEHIVLYENPLGTDSFNWPNYGSDVATNNPDFISVSYEDMGLTAFRPAAGSPLLNASTSEENWDGLSADIGPFGGPLGALWDLDNDGVYANPGNISEEDDSFTDWDCDDLDAAVLNGECE